MHCRALIASSSSLLLTAVFLTGCGMGTPGTTLGSNAVTQGRIMGGQQPISHATVQFYAASNSGYAAASTALLATPLTSDANGSFAVTTPFTCPTPGTLVYIVATSGNPGFDETGGTVNNTASALMAALGRCDSLNASTNIILNEVTTVAAVWALAPFMTSYDHVGTSGTNPSGLINAFGMAGVLANYSGGSTPGNIPTGAIVPVAEINTMANVLASCVNTKGGTSGDSTPCGNLFAFATPGSNVVAGVRRPHFSNPPTAPTNTIAAALDIALNPGNSATAISLLPTPQAPFQPSGYAANDWTVSVTFSVGARTTSNMAFDANGNLFVVASDALYELSPTGAVLGAFTSMAGNDVAIDASGNIWVTTASANLAKMPSNLSTPAIIPAPNASSAGIDGIGIDGSGNPWYTCDSCSAVYKLNASNNAVSPYTVTGQNISSNVSIDGNENVWLGNFTYAQANVLKPNGDPLANSPLSCGNCGHPAFIANDSAGNAWIVGNDLTHLVTATDGITNYDTSQGGIFSPAAVAVDGAGNAWVSNLVSFVSTESGSVSEFNAAGVAVSPATAYLSDSVLTPQSIAVDGSGNVWVRNTGAATVTAFVGAGVPAVTPLAVAVKNNSLGSKP